MFINHQKPQRQWTNVRKINKPVIKSLWTDSLLCLEVHQRVKEKKKKVSEGEVGNMEKILKNVVNFKHLPK